MFALLALSAAAALAATGLAIYYRRKFTMSAELDKLKTTTMGRDIAETYARSPSFYSGTFCVTCKGHFPVGAAGEFVWAGTDEKVGT